MKVVSPIERRDGLIAARASTEERMRADRLMQQLKLSSYGQLVRQLLDEKANEMGVA